MKYFPETRVKLKLSKEKEIEQLFEIKSISADYRKRKCESGKEELNQKRLKTEVKNKRKIPFMRYFFTECLIFFI